MGLLPVNFAKNYLWPTLMALGSAIVTALATGAPALVMDGIQASDWPELLGIIVAAALGYFANVMSRYGGKREPWVDPPVEPTPSEKANGL